jgi:hypothetical protein
VYVKATSDAAELLFDLDGPAAPGAVYTLYYLAFDDGPCVTGPAYACTSTYGTAAAAGLWYGRLRAFRARVTALLDSADWRETLARADVVGYEARTARERCHPGPGLSLQALEPWTARVEPPGSSRQLAE